MGRGKDTANGIRNLLPVIETRTPPSFGRLPIGPGLSASHAATYLHCTVTLTGFSSCVPYPADARVNHMSGEVKYRMGCLDNKTLWPSG